MLSSLSEFWGSLSSDTHTPKNKKEKKRGSLSILPTPLLPRAQVGARRSRGWLRYPRPQPPDTQAEAGWPLPRRPPRPLGHVSVIAPRLTLRSFSRTSPKYGWGTVLGTSMAPRLPGSAAARPCRTTTIGSDHAAFGPELKPASTNGAYHCEPAAGGFARNRRPAARRVHAAHRSASVPRRCLTSRAPPSGPQRARQVAEARPVLAVTPRGLVWAGRGGGAAGSPPPSSRELRRRVRALRS